VKTTKYTNSQLVIKRGINALFRELGPVDTQRFIEMSRSKREESVKRHRKLQQKIKRHEFLNEIFSF